MKISCRVLSEMKELIPVCELIKKIWGEKNSIAPYLLRAQTKMGGLIIGAFDGEHLIGISYGFPGTGTDGEVFFYSHILGVETTYRGNHVGVMLKHFQAKSAIQKGYSKIKWTFDPLQTLNANLNIRRLGVTSNTYLPDFYGEMSDHLNAGIPSDRLLVEWDVRNPKQMDEPNPLAQYTNVLQMEESSQLGFPIVLGCKQVDKQYILIAVPTDFQKIKEQSNEHAIRWRSQTRDAFQYYFLRGYRMMGFRFIPDRSIQYYLLHKK